MTSPHWKRRPDGSNWGEFGPDDQAGRLNLLTAEKVREGIREVQGGLTFCLSLPLDHPGGVALNPRRHPPVLRPTMRDGRPNFNCTLSGPDEDKTDVFNDDLAILHLQYSTQWDGLAHVGALFDADDDGVAERVYYNGYRAGVDVLGPADPRDCGPGTESTSRAVALGIQTMAARCVQGRGVMIDLRAHLGDDAQSVGYDTLMRVMDAGDVRVDRGDMVCLHTGFADRVLEMHGDPDPHTLHGTCASLDGRDARLLQWITDSGLSVIAADNYAVETFPARPGGVRCSTLPLHEHCLFKIGVHLGELWHLTPLADWLRAHGRTRFLLTAPPLRLPGAIASPLTPVATV